MDATFRDVEFGSGRLALRSTASCNSGSEVSRPPQHDDDATGIDDPFIDELPAADESAEEAVDDGPLSEVPIGLPLAPTDLASPDEGRLGPEFAEQYAFDESPSPLMDDDEQGPPGPLEWADLSTPAAIEVDDPADGPLEPDTLSVEPLAPMDRQEDDDTVAEVPLSTIDVDDDEPPWSRERWPECPLRVAFSARQSLALVGSTLCVSGEETHLVHTRLLVPLENLPFGARTKRILCLDSDASRLLILTVTGQLYLWHRSPGASSAPKRIGVQNDEVISMIWQLAPGVPTLLVRVESGRLLEWDDASESLKLASPQNPKHRLRALSELGEPLVSLWQERDRSRLCVGLGAPSAAIPLTPMMERAIAESTPMLAAFVDYILLGVRDHGLFLHGPESAEFLVVPGCRRITALAVGLMQQRPTAFVGLFSELDDKTEVVAVDLQTRKAARVAELSVITDGAGPEDDPPERARVDALLWDPSSTRLWAAGCFGLTSFCPQSSSTTS